jgi:hypothetical protein
MIFPEQAPEPFLFSALKHHLDYIRMYIEARSDPEDNNENKQIIKELRHLGTTVMDVYNGRNSTGIICGEIAGNLQSADLFERESYSVWTGKGVNDYRIIELSDGSKWTLKYHNSDSRYVHFFPARSSPHSFRVKANTLKSAILYLILIGKDYVNAGDLNYAREMAGLSPVRDTLETEAITEMIEILRS